MKKKFLIIFIIPFFAVYSQKIGEIAKEKPNMVFPNNALGLDLMIGEAGFGIGGFYRYKVTTLLTAFTDFSISESKSSREFDRYDIFGYPIPVYGKKNRLYLLPLDFGIQYRLFYHSLTDNLRPYVCAAFGPTMFVTSPAQKEFFKSLSYAKVRFGIGGYIGIGANFGTNPNNLTGINVRYYFHGLFNKGIEQYYGTYTKNFQQFALTINIGMMY